MTEEIPGTVLVVDDSPDTVELIERNLEMNGYSVLTATGAEGAIRVLEDNAVDLVVTDMNMPRVSGLELLRHVKNNWSDVDVIVVTGFGTVENAVAALKEGASEYLLKPFTDDELLAAVARSMDKRRMKELAVRGEGLQVKQGGIIGESEAMRKVFALIEKAADNPATVLITGESGTGKELVARAIHYSGPRASLAFVPVNCGGIPEGLLESELFGHVKGAFTGASESRAGFFQTADGGTIFLDEIGETSLSMQVKLLRVLQDREVCMVGSSKIKKVDVRVIAATNKDLRSLVDKSLFREDLYFRLNVILINLPPLRERDDDVLLLAAAMLRKYATEYGKPTPRLTERAMRLLKAYRWPGNVRELENLMQRLVVMLDSGLVDAGDLPEYMRLPFCAEGHEGRTLAEVEASHIRLVMESVDGNKSRAAEVLGIDRKTLRAKLVRYGIGDDTGGE